MLLRDVERFQFCHHAAACGVLLRDVERFQFCHHAAACGVLLRDVERFSFVIMLRLVECC